jgi:hypothetical protein
VGVRMVLKRDVPAGGLGRAIDLIGSSRGRDVD